MRVLYDTYWWSTGPISGRVVAREILKAWMAEFPQDEFVLGVRPRDRSEVECAFPGVRTVRIFGRPHGIATILQYGWHARRHGANIAYTQNFAPPGVWSAIFVHDVMFQTNPEWFTVPERAYFWLIATFARGADLVVTSSEHEAQRIRDNNPRLRRVVPIGLSVSGALADAEPRVPDVAVGLDGFTLTVGRLNVRKNLGAALAGALDSGRLSPEKPLVVVGGGDGKSADLPDRVARAAKGGLIRFVPYVDDAELSWLYQHADLFVYLALDEGFGLPPVEALHFGTPVLVSDIDVFHENLGSIATYVDPRDISAIARTLAEVPTNRVDGSSVLRSWTSSAQLLRSAVVEAKGPSVG